VVTGYEAEAFNAKHLHSKHFAGTLLTVYRFIFSLQTIVGNRHGHAGTVVVLRQRECQCRDGPGLGEAASRRPANTVPAPRYTIARSIVAQCVFALVRAIGCHQVGQHWNSSEEMGARGKRL
jgi:hypothetical protein